MAIQRGLAPAHPSLADGGYLGWTSTTEQDGVVRTMAQVRDLHRVFFPGPMMRKRAPVLLHSCPSCWLMLLQLFRGSSPIPPIKLLYHARRYHQSLDLTIIWVSESCTALNDFISCPIFCSFWLFPHATFGHWSLGLFLHVTFGMLTWVISRQTFTPLQSVMHKLYLSSPFSQPRVIKNAIYNLSVTRS